MANPGENFLSNIYKSFNVNDKEKQSLESELKISKVLDSKGNVSIEDSKIFNYTSGDNIFDLPSEKTIFDGEKNSSFGKVTKSKKMSAKENTSISMNNSLFNTEVFDDVDLLKSEKSTGLGGSFDLIG